MDRETRNKLEAEERAYHADPEGTLRRRDFLRRTAYTAGLAGAAMVPMSTLLAEAAKTTAMASGGASGPIDHFVFLMMENRSFDHYFGWYSALADAVQARSYPDPDNGNILVPTHHASTMGQAQWQGCW